MVGEFVFESIACDLAVMVEFLHLNGRQYMSECAACLVCVDHSYSAEQEHTHTTNHCPIIYLNNITSCKFYHHSFQKHSPTRHLQCSHLCASTLHK